MQGRFASPAAIRWTLNVERWILKLISFQINAERPTSNVQLSTKKNGRSFRPIEHQMSTSRRPGFPLRSSHCELRRSFSMPIPLAAGPNAIPSIWPRGCAVAGTRSHSLLRRSILPFNTLMMCISIPARSRALAIIFNFSMSWIVILPPSITILFMQCCPCAAATFITRTPALRSNQPPVDRSNMKGRSCRWCRASPTGSTAGGSDSRRSNALF